MKANNFAKNLILPLFTLASSFSIPLASADFTSLSCYGIDDKWTSEANRILHLLEDQANAEVNHYVTMANFDIGSTNFGIQGAASLGHLQAPPFTCSDPKLTLKSGAPDFGITPNYLITARVFGMPVSIVDARMEGAQGQATAKNPSAPRPKHNVMFSLKVMGVDVLQQIVKGPETEAHTAQELQNLVGAPDPSALADKQKTGAGGKLFDFSRSISQMLRTKPRLDIVPGVLYVAVDAGFYLQSDLIFTYGVNTAIHDFRGSKQITSSLGMNPVKAADEICVAADSPGAACTNKTASVAAKDKNFFQTLASGVTSNFDRAKMLREQVRSQNLGELASRARIVRDSFRGDWDKLFDGSLDLNGKKSYIQSIPMSERMSPFADKTEKLKATGDAAKGISSDLSTTYSQVQKILATSQNGLPAVTADAGFAISGRAGAWASAVLAVDAVVVRGWAGILGYLTLIDVRMGVGAVLSTKSQYLDLTATMDTIRMAGGLNLIFGAEVGISPFVATFAGQRPLYVFPGSMTHKDVLVGRLDFRAGQTGKPALFWCTDIFGSATVDPDRCSDVDLPKAALAPAFAAYNDLKKDTLGEMIVDDAAGCIVSDGGKPIFSSPDASNCASILPATSTTALASTAAGVAHPLARYFNQDPESFMTDLRNAQNQPVKVFSANGIVNGEAGTPNSVIYAANSALSAPSVGGLGGRVLQFVEQLPLNNIADDSSLGARIYSLGSRAQYVSPATPIPGVTTYDLGDASVNGLLINMDWASSAGMWPTDWQAGITVVDPKIFVGDLGALPNNILADMGQNFRLGRCGVQSENNGSDFTINVSSRPFPYEGDIEGKVSENMTSTDDTCFLAGASSGMGDAKVAYTACTLRRALRTGECFPPERVIELVRLANLTNQDALKYFLGAAAGSPKLISGDIFPNGKVYDSYVDQQEIGFTVRCNTDACHRSILSDFFYSQYSGTVFTWPYVSDFNNPNANSDRVKRCNLLYTGDQDNSSSYEEHWFNREYLSGRNGTVIRLKSRGSATCFKVAATAGTVVQPNFSVGDSGACLTNAFHARYTAPYTNRMSPLICDPNNSGNRSRYADTALNGTGSNLKSQALATNADSTGTMGYYLARSVKRCIGNDHQCVYTPDGDTSDAAQLASSTCNMKVDQMVASGAGASLSVPGPGGTTSLNGCLQQASSPNFSDAAVFCNDSGVAAQLKSLFGINPNGTTAFNYSVRLTAAWDANRQVTNVADSGSHSEQEVGRCFLTRQAGSTLIEITGQTMSLPGRNLASAAGNSNCSLYIDKNSAATLIRSNPKDPIPALDPTSSDNKCAETLGFYGTTSDIQAKANEYCSNLSPSDTLDVFGGQTGLVRTGTLRYYITGGAPGTGAVRTQSCSVTHTDAEWTAALGGADCTLAFTPYGTSNAIAQTVLLPVTDANGHNGDRTACEAAINAQMTCAKIQAMSAYAPYAPGGATVSGKYGNTAVGSPSSRTCSGAYAPNGENSTSTSCKLAGWMTAPYQSSTREFDNTLLTTPAVAASLASSSNASSACQTAWSDRVAATNNGSSTNFLFCTSALSTVSSSLYSRRANWMNCTDDLSDSDNPFYCLLRDGNIWTTQDGNPPLASSGAGNYPISISFKSHYGSAAASSSNPLVTTCRYDFREVAGSSGSQWQLAAEGMPSYVTAEGASEKVCIRPSGNVPIDPANPNCALLPNGSTLLFGGAGPGLLAQTPSTAANPNYSSHQASTCSTFLPQMTAISDLVQNDPTKRLPMWVRTVDSLGRVTPPKEKDAADFYCSQNTSCNLVAEFGAESRNISLGFLQTWGITPTTSQACLGLNQSASGSTCIDLRADDSVPDNLPIDLYSVYGDERRLIQTCDVGTPKACVIGAARGSANDLYLMLEKPMGSGLLSLTGHQGSFGTSNTKQNCADYFDSDSYCGMDTPYTNDQNHPGESYGIYRQFGLDRSTQSTCYSALNLSIDAYEGNLRASWTDIHPNSGHYELQYCEGPGCIPGGITDSTHFNLMIPLADGVQKTTVTNPGVVYRYRARYVSDATSTPWSSTVDAMSPGTAMPPMQLATFTADIYEIPRDRIVFNWVPMNGTVSGFYEFGFCHGAGCDPTDGNSTNFTMAAPNGSPSEIQPDHPTTYGIKLRFKMHQPAPLLPKAYPWSTTTVYVTTSCIVWNATGWTYCANTGPGTSTNPSVGSGSGGGGGVVVGDSGGIPPRTTQQVLLDSCLKLNFSACSAYIATFAAELQNKAATDLKAMMGSNDGFFCTNLKLFCGPAPAPFTYSTLEKVVLDKKIPETMGWVDAKGRSLEVSFKAPSPDYSKEAVPVFECRMGMKENISGLEFAPCDRKKGTTTNYVAYWINGDGASANSKEGMHTLQVRLAVGDKKGAITSTDFFMHLSLNGVARCEEPLADEVFFNTAKRILVSRNTFGPQTELTQYPNLHVQFSDKTKVDVTTLRRRLVPSSDNRHILFRRTYSSTRNGQCKFVDQSTRQISIRLPNRERLFEGMRFDCHAIVFDSEGNAACLDEKANFLGMRKGFRNAIEQPYLAKNRRAIFLDAGLNLRPIRTGGIRGLASVDSAVDVAVNVPVDTKSGLCNLSDLFCTTTKVGETTIATVNDKVSDGTTKSDLKDSVTKSVPESDGLLGSERRVFLTSAKVNGNFGGIAGADAFCAKIAASAGLSRKYRAVISDQSSSFASRIQGAQSIYEVSSDGKKTLVLNPLALLKGYFQNDPVVNYDETGAVAGTGGEAPTFWIATDTVGNSTAQTCENWTSASGDLKGDIGSTNSGEVLDWRNPSDCAVPHRLVCFSE